MDDSAVGYTSYSPSSSPWIFIVVGVIMLLVGLGGTGNFNGIRERWLKYPSPKNGSDSDGGASTGNAVVALLGYAFIVFGAIFVVAGIIRAA